MTENYQQSQSQRDDVPASDEEAQEKVDNDESGQERVTFPEDLDGKKAADGLERVADQKV